MPKEIIPIDLTQINPIYTYPLYLFFKNSKDTQKWVKNKVYTFADGTEFTLMHDVFQRARKNQKWDTV